MSAAQSDRPNYLILMADQHNPRVMGCAGDKVVRTPNLDAFAATGVHFENAYCQAPICVPARMSFLTGQQPSANRVWDNGDMLASDIPTFAHALGASNYETALIGRMHFTGVDAWHGFEELRVGNVSPIYPHVPQVLPPHLLIGAQGNSRAGVTLAGPGRTAYQLHDELITASTVEFLRQHQNQQQRPFCAVAGFLLPHAPFICPKAVWDYYIDRVSLPKMPPGYFESLHPAMKLWRKVRGVENLTDEEIRRARAAYYGLVTQLDRMLGQIFDALKQTGLDRNTIVIYTSDHGEMAGEKGHWWKQTFYDGSVTVPLIVSCPSRFQPRRVREIVSHIDIAPTLTDLAAADKLPNTTGHSLAPLLKGEKTNWPNEAFSELFQSLGVPPIRMLRSGRWKLVHFEGMRPQLFDLETDPNEYRDLGESPQHAEIRNKLHARAREGWSAAEMEKTLAQRRKNTALLRKWGQLRQPPTPQLWRPPEGVNVFPEN